MLARQVLLDVATNSSADELARLLHEAALIQIESAQVKGLDHTLSKHQNELIRTDVVESEENLFASNKYLLGGTASPFRPAHQDAGGFQHSQIPASVEHCKG